MKFFQMITVMIGLSLNATVAADEIPADLLKMDLDKCTATCPTVNGKKVCQFLCECTIEHFKKGLDYDKYVVLMAEMSQQRLSQANRLFLLDVGRACESQLDGKFPELKKDMLKPKAKTKAKAKPKT